MKSQQTDRLGVQILWVMAPVLLIAVTVFVVVTLLDGKRGRVANLSRQVSEQYAALEAFRNDRGSEKPSEPGEVVEECRLMVASEPLRVEELSLAARASGVSLISISSLDSNSAPDATVVGRGHRVRGSGSYAQLAQFLDGVYMARGLAAVDNLVIEPAEDPRDGLVASLEVTWFAMATAADRAEASPQ
ncbi:MAG: hypothetical protein ACI8QZ_003462 [Chlamydiales bacterium]